MTEHHNYFPSGIWDGFYLYQSGPDSNRHEMYFYLDFTDGIVTGSGSDDVGGFTWNGSYNMETFVVKMTKHYRMHTVNYDGRADESGIYGRWEIKGDLNGGFHIWPRKGKAEAEEEVVEATISAETGCNSQLTLTLQQLQGRFAPVAVVAEVRVLSLLQ